jgi:parallel beta-helix repeat protein
MTFDFPVARYIAQQTRAWLSIYALVGVVTALGLTALGVVSATAQGTVYNAVPNPLAPNYASLGFQATQTAEFGDFVHLTGTSRTLNTVTITMSDWALQSAPANVTYCNNNPGTCDATGFLHPFKLTIYNPGSGTPGTRSVGSAIATVTQVKRVPWRPAADPSCSNPTAWRSPVDNQCYNGYAFNLSFDMSSLGAVLPNDVIVGIAYNTQTWGASPTGVDGPYNSLNVSVVGALNAGTDDNTDFVYWNTSTAGNYSDGGAAGVGIFREDSNWGSPSAFGTIPIQITTTTNRLVRPSNQLDWVASTTSGGTVGFVADGTAPSGTGALNLTTINDNNSRAQYSRVENVPLSNVYQASYWTKTNSGSAYAAASYAIGVYLDGTPLTFTSFVFEPYFSDGLGDPAPVLANTWQKWEVYSNPNLWSSRTVNAGGGCATVAGSGGPPFYSLAAIKAACPNAVVVSHSVYMGSFNPDWNVNVDLVNFNGTVWDFDPDPSAIVVDDDGMGTVANCNAATPTPSTIQAGINAASAGQIVKVCPGNYVEDVTINKADLILQGSGVDISTITGPYSGGGENTVTIVAPGVTVDGFTITRDGNTVGQWDGNTHNQGINAVASSNFTLQNSKVTGNRNGIYVGQSSYNVLIRRNIIEFNRTGIHLVDNNGALIEENFVRNNWTIGILYRCEGCGIDPSPMTVRNNNISGNWYSEVEFRQPAGSSLLNMSGNYFGTTNPTRVTTTSGEPPYTSQIPVAYGGTAVPPASHPTFAGTQSARIDYSPFLDSGVDTQPGTPGFQGNFMNVSVSADSPQANGSAGNIQEGIALASTGGTVTALNGTYPGNVTVNKAVTLRGTPTISGALSITAAGAAIQPGFSPGVINSGNLSLVSGSNVNIELNGSSVGTGYDQLNVAGTVNLGGSTLNVSTSYSIANGSQFVIVSNDGTDPVTGTFAGLAESGTLTVSGTTFTISYVGGDGNDVVLTATAVTCNNISIPTNIQTLTNQQVVVPLNIDDTTGRGILSFTYTLNYNSSVLSYIGVDQVGTLSATYSFSVNSTTPGTLVINGFGTAPLTGSGVLMNIRFQANGAIGTTSAMNFGSVLLNEGVPCVNTSNGSVTVISSTISGIVSYGNSPSFVPVPHTTLNAAGSVPQSTTSAVSTGAYTLSGLGAGSYTVTPSKSGNVNGISGFDAALISQHVVGLITLNSNQLAAADVSNNGTVSGLDASYISQWVVNIPNPSVTGTWKFQPTSRNYTNVNTAWTNQDYVGILMGEVSGNWAAPTSLAGFALYEKDNRVIDEKNAVRVDVPNLRADAGSEVVVPISVGDLTGRGVIAYQFDVKFDPKVLETQEVAADVDKSISNGMTVVSNSPEPGLLKVVVYGPKPINGDGTLMYLKFRAIGSIGTRSDIKIEEFMFNDGDIDVLQKDGGLSIRESDGASIEGRLVAPLGGRFGGIRVTLTSTTGETRSVIATEKGRFDFGGLTVGETYIVSVDSKSLRFSPRTISVVEGKTTIQMTSSR